ncbi:MAG: GldG family protein [Thermodesulfobacteriota bacterium]
MEGVKKAPQAAKILAWLGLVLLAGGGLHYSTALMSARHGLWAMAAGLALLVLAAVAGWPALKAFLGRRSARLGLGAGASVLVVLALAMFLGALAARHHLRWDLSQGGVHTLSEQSVELTRGLTEPVEALAFFKEGQAGKERAEGLLTLYAYQNPKFTWRMVDPDREPAVANRYEVRNYGVVVLARGERHERAKLPEEQEVTNALLRLTRGAVKTVYFLSGHGEASLEETGKDGYSQLKSAVAEQNYQVKPLLLVQAKAVPDDAAAVVAAGPKRPLLEGEVQALADYLGKGGGLLLLLEPDRDSGLKDWLAGLGVILRDDLVLDQASSLVGASPAWPVVADYGEHQITKPLQGVFCYFPLARSLQIKTPLPQGVKATELLRTTQSAWGETDLGALMTGKASFEQGKDTPGPLALGAVLDVMAPEPQPNADQPPPDKKPAVGHLVVIGDSDFAANAHLNQAGNRDLFLNAVGYLAEEKDQITIRPKQQASQPLLLQPDQALVAFLAPVVVLPLGFIVAGVVVVLRRRRRRA